MKQMLPSPKLAWEVCPTRIPGDSQDTRVTYGSHTQFNFRLFMLSQGSLEMTTMFYYYSPAPFLISGGDRVGKVSLSQTVTIDTSFLILLLV